MTTPCPQCGAPLVVFYSLDRQLVVCKCYSHGCPMSKVEATGHRVQEALDTLNGMHLVMEARKTRTKPIQRRSFAEV